VPRSLDNGRVTEPAGEPRIEISPEPEPEERDAILRAATSGGVGTTLG